MNEDVTKRWVLVIMYTVSFVASLVQIFLAGKDHRWTMYVFGFIAVCLALYPLVILAIRQVLPYWLIRSSVRRMSSLIRERGKPDLLIAFDRSSGILACMVGQNLAIPEILVLNRRRRNNGSDDSSETTVSVGDGLTLSTDFAAKNKAVIAFHIRTGETLHNGLSFLRSQGMNTDIKVFAMYMTDGAKARWPKIPFLNTSAGEVPRYFLPWVSGPYPHD